MQMPSQLNQNESFNETRNWVNSLQDHEKMSDSQHQQQIPSHNRSQILIDARILVNRLQQRDKMTDSLIRYAQGVTEKINCLKEYKDDLTELQEMHIAQQPRSALVANLQQENRQIKILQLENRQLKLALEDHQATLEMIMQRYRQQVVEMIKLNKLQQIADRAVGDVVKNSVADESNKLLEYASLFDHCLKVGEEASTKDLEELTRLKTENQTLRQLLKIAAQNNDFPSNVQRKASPNPVESDAATPTSVVDVVSVSQIEPVSVSSKTDDQPTTSGGSVLSNPPPIEPVPAVRKKSAGRSFAAAEPVPPQRAKSAVNSVVNSTVVTDVPANQSTVITVVKSGDKTVVATSNAVLSTPTTTAVAKPAVPRTVPPSPSNAAAKRPSQPTAKIQPTTPTTPSQTANVKKSVSQDSGLVNGGIPTAAPPAAKVSSSVVTKNPTGGSSGTVKRKSSAGDLKVVPQTVVVGTVPTPKQSNAAQHKTGIVKGTPIKSGSQNR